jgi:hypothetical protein
MRGLADLLLLGPLTATPERAATPIIDGPTVLQRSPAAIQATLGRPIRTKAVPAGDVYLPEGGTSRAYDGRGTYEAALEAVNLPSDARPNLIGRDRREWHNLDGYFVRVIAAYPALDSIDVIVLSVDPLP